LLRETSLAGVDGSLIVASIAGGISLIALGAGRYDRWREGKQRREDLERAEQQRQQDLERSRPGFAVEWNWNLGQSGVWIGVNVTTLPGRPSTSLIEVGFAVDGELELDNAYGEGPEPAHARGHGSFPIHQEITPCQSGRRYPFQVQLHGLGPIIDPDTELIPYVVDVEGTRHEGRPFAIFGRLLEEGWTPPDDLSTLPLLRVTYTYPPEREGEVGTFNFAAIEMAAMETRRQGRT
jgi:hypothetical protein